MKSNKQRVTEIKAARLKRAERRNPKFDPTKYPVPEHAIPADQTKLVTVGTEALVDFPIYYLDKPYVCTSCGSTELWTAKQQKWWYEVAQGAIETTVAHCRACRKQMREDKAKQKQHMKDMANRVQHKNDAFFKNT